MQPSTLAKRAWQLFFIVVAAFFLFGLGRLPFVGPDEPRYAQVAREMFLRHDLITPTLGGHHWFEKPALLYWMMMGSFAAFGVSEWAARLGPSLCGLLTIAAVYWIARRVSLKSGGAGKSSGYLAALVIATSAGLIVFAKAASFDIVVTLTTTWALVFFLGAEIEDVKHGRWLLAGFYSMVGVSLLAKGLVGLVIPFGVVFGYFVLRRRLPRRETLISLCWGMPLALIVAAVWYGPVIARNGWPFIDQFFIQHHFARYLSNKYHHPQPFYFYLLVIILFTLPWTPLLIDALFRARHWQWRADDAESRFHVFMLAWLLFPLIFFSFSGSKLAGYILPALPAAALLAADRIERLLNETASGWWLMRVAGALLLCFALGLVIYGERSGSISLRCGLLVVAPLVLAGGLVLVWQRRRQLAAVLIALSVTCATSLALFCAADGFARRESVRDLIRLANDRGYGSAPVFALRHVDRTVEFYAAGRVAYDPDGEPTRFETAAEVANKAREIRVPMLVILLIGRVPQLTGLPGVQATVIGDNGNVALVAVSAE